METLKQLLGYGTIPVYEGLKGKKDVSCPDTLVGIEIELEQVKVGQTPPTWTPDKDGSLKVAGMEFISCPLQVKYLEVELARLFDGLKNSHASTRCSIHVHVNAQDFTLEDLHKFLIIYMIFEKSLFRVSGNRWKNLYCTPLYNNPDLVAKFFQKPFKGWHKYFALNLAPLYGDKNEGSAKHGTIEFRHMAGSNNRDDIFDWVNIVVSIRKAIKDFKLDDLIEDLRVMNTSSGYVYLARKVFGNWHPFITEQPTFKEDVERCITITKTVMFGEDGKSVIKFPEVAAMDNEQRHNGVTWAEYYNMYHHHTDMIITTTKLSVLWQQRVLPLGLTIAYDLYKVHGHNGNAIVTDYNSEHWPDNYKTKAIKAYNAKMKPVIKPQPIPHAVYAAIDIEAALAQVAPTIGVWTDTDVEEVVETPPNWQPEEEDF